MLSPNLRLLLIGVFFIGGVISIAASLGLYVSIVFFLTAAILLLGHFRHGPVLAVLMALRRGKVGQAEELLQTVKRPDWLSKRYRTYYYFATSLVATHRQDVNGAEQYAELALQEDYLQPREQAILVYNLARVEFERNNWARSRQHLSNLDQLPIDDLHLKERVQELHNALDKCSA